MSDWIEEQCYATTTLDWNGVDMDIEWEIVAPTDTETETETETETTESDGTATPDPPEAEKIQMTKKIQSIIDVITTQESAQFDLVHLHVMACSVLSALILV